MTLDSTPQPIASRDNPRVARWRRIAGDPAGYRRHGSVWLDGEHLCEAWAAAGRAAEHAVVVDEAWQLPRVRRLAAAAGAVARVPKALMAAISGLDSPPPIAFVAAWPGNAALAPDAPSVVLDRVQDAGNVGTLLRSAAAFGYTQVVALTGTAALWSPKVLRAAMGAHTALALVEGADHALLAALRVPLLATAARATTALWDAALPWPCAWLFGHEGQGVAPVLAARCAQTLGIPQPGGGESLNVAAAAAVCFYESARQRRGATR